jgi:hypothetical protein
MNQKNGAATVVTKQQSTNGKPSEVVGKIQQTNGKKEELPSITPIPKTELRPSIEDRFLKMDVLFSKREKWEKIKDSLDKLNKFKLSTDGRTDNIIFKDAVGTTFSTYNPDVITKVVDMLKEDLSKKLSEVEQEINL